jgi:hypothetical protein
VVFDEEADRHVVIPWEDAIGASFCVTSGGGGTSSIPPNTVVGGGKGLGVPGSEALTYITESLAKKNDAWVLAEFTTAGVPRGDMRTTAEMEAAYGLPAAGDDLKAGEWRDLANCWRLIAKYGANHNFGPGPGLFPIKDEKAGGAIAADSFAISMRFRGASMTEFMEIPEFRVYCVVARPFIEHVMQSAVMAVAGRDTGAMLFGPSDMQISANTQVKTIEG